MDHSLNKQQLHTIATYPNVTTLIASTANDGSVLWKWVEFWPVGYAGVVGKCQVVLSTDERSSMKQLY